MKQFSLVGLVCLLACTGAAWAGDYASFEMVGIVDRFDVVSTSGTGSVVQATLKLSVLNHGSNGLSMLCARGGDAINGFTVGACEVDTLFDGCSDIVAPITPREDGSGLTDGSFTCAEGSTCVEVSGFMLGSPQTSAMAVAIVDSVTVSTDCTAR